MRYLNSYCYLPIIAETQGGGVQHLTNYSLTFQAISFPSYLRAVLDTWLLDLISKFEVYQFGVIQSFFFWILNVQHLSNKMCNFLNKNFSFFSLRSLRTQLASLYHTSLKPFHMAVGVIFRLRKSRYSRTKDGVSQPLCGMRHAF